jgi:hypothetical protein
MPFGFTDSDFVKVIQEAKTPTEALRLLGVHRSQSWKDLYFELSRLQIGTTHWVNTSSKRGAPGVAKPLNDVLVEHSDYCRKTLKKRLVKEGLLPYVCSGCNRDSWLGKPLALQIDHINGVSDDNRLGNLRFLCPNCHSQTDTFSGRNKRTLRGAFVCGCGTPVKTSGRKCRVCAARLRGDKIQWPSKETLAEMVRGRKVSATARILGVSEAAVRKRLAD